MVAMPGSKTSSQAMQEAIKLTRIPNNEAPCVI